jgi:TonB family protein
VVNEKGKVQDVRIAKGLSSEHDAEAKRVVQLLEYKPGESNGKPVAMKMNLPIRFRKKT